MYPLHSHSRSASKWERLYGEFTCPICRRNFVQLLPMNFRELAENRFSTRAFAPSYQYVCSQCHRPLRLTRIFNGRGEEILIPTPSRGKIPYPPPLNMYDI